jgi:hypothetical protein
MRHLLALLLGTALLVVSGEGRCDFVNRSASTVAWAIGAGPGGSALGKPVRLAYAKALLDVAREHNFDPFTGVAIIEHESRWRAGAVSRDGEDYGLAQIRARFRAGCNDDADPVNAPDAACKAAKARLLNPIASMKAMGHAISLWRTLCKSNKRGTGRAALLHRWLAGYGGMHRPSRGIRCGQRKVRGQWRDLPMRKGVRWIVDHRKSLIRKLKRRRR